MDPTSSDTGDYDGEEPAKPSYTAAQLHAIIIANNWCAEMVWAERDGSAFCPLPRTDGAPPKRKPTIKVVQRPDQLIDPILIWRNDGEES
jgi:hypothetical protein